MYLLNQMSIKSGVGVYNFCAKLRAAFTPLQESELPGVYVWY